MATVTNAAVPTLIGSVQRALKLLEAVGAHPDGAPAKQLAREAGVPLPTAYHLLRTLTHEDYLRREKGVFVLGEAVGRLTLGGVLQNRRSRLEESLVHWRDAIGVPVYFGSRSPPTPYATGSPCWNGSLRWSECNRSWSDRNMRSARFVPQFRSLPDPVPRRWRFLSLSTRQDGCCLLLRNYATESEGSSAR